MDGNREQVYRLYALSVTQNAVEIAMKERFSRIAPGYILIYTADEKPEHSAEINGADIRRLTKADEDWIMLCAAALLRERLDAAAPQSMENLSRMIDELSEALDAERRKSGGERGETDGNRNTGTE